MGAGGGCSVTYAAYCVRMRAGCPGGGKGPLIQTEKTGTLCPNNDQTLFVPSLKTTNLQIGASAAERLKPAGVITVEGVKT